ncbi:hypothetical protein LTR08_001821 [Meristemomyces frigidus]|nr:hypothetical protein LTR08_001821 [Meristemomyces frigidus]
MDAYHMFLIATGSGLCSSLATVYQLGPKGKWAALGASGIVSAFVSIAALGAPRKRVQIDGRFFEASMSTTVFRIVTLFSDLALWQARVMHKKGALPSSLRKMFSDNPEYLRVGTSAHLAGAAFGAIYYLVFLRPGAEMSIPTQQLLTETPDSGHPHEGLVDCESSEYITMPSFTPSSATPGSSECGSEPDEKASQS